MTSEDKFPQLIKKINGLEMVCLYGWLLFSDVSEKSLSSNLFYRF